MELKDWLSPLIAGILGGLSVKIFDILYQEFRRRSESQDAAKQFVDEHLDPLLKAADELVGKLLSLAREDFNPTWHFFRLAGADLASFFRFEYQI